MKKYGSLEEIIKHLDKDKYTVPEGFADIIPAVRELFKSPEVLDPTKLADQVSFFAYCK
jgi:hypothetical protein